MCSFKDIYCLIDCTNTLIASMIGVNVTSNGTRIGSFKAQKPKMRFSPFALFLGNLELLVLPEDDTPLSLMESWAEEALPVASLSRIMLSYPLLPPLW